MDMQDKVNICGVCKDISNSGKKLCMKFFRKTRLEKLHIVIEWGIKIVLLIICLKFVEDVWSNYWKKDTNLKDTKTEIKIDHPTMVICFEPNVKITELRETSLKHILFAHEWREGRRRRRRNGSQSQSASWSSSSRQAKKEDIEQMLI